jgi:hypothetical protein
MNAIEWLCVWVVCGFVLVTISIRMLTRSLQRHSSKVQALLAEIRDKLGK